mmetsp:Transcript_78072/g.226528  ORF Transcript_78072/g.226528 Transcript_78072/m.226528 type:complete len:315 (-) Transcript_78072:79-1023(-)
MSDPEFRKSSITVGFPYWHSSLFIGSLLGLSVVTFPEDLDRLATVETFTRRIFPELLSLPGLAIIRLGVAAVCWSVMAYMLLYDDWTIETTYRPHSRLQNTTLRIAGLKTLCPFTSWAWIMLGSTYSLTGYVALMAHAGRGDEIEPWVLRSALVLWELSAPFALLVSAVVRYAIWPVVIATGRKHGLGSFRNQMQHNVNTLYALSEMAMLGGLPLEFAHISLPMFVGCIYILFTWFNCYSYTDEKFGPQYLYWFMDPTLGERTSLIALLALVSTLVLSFVTFYCIEAIVKLTGKNPLMHLLCVVLVSSAVIRTK